MNILANADGKSYTEIIDSITKYLQPVLLDHNKGLGSVTLSINLQTTTGEYCIQNEDECFLYDPGFDRDDYEKKCKAAISYTKECWTRFLEIRERNGIAFYEKYNSNKELISRLLDIQKKSKNPNLTKTKELKMQLEQLNSEYNHNILLDDIIAFCEAQYKKGTYQFRFSRSVRKYLDNDDPYDLQATIVFDNKYSMAVNGEFDIFHGLT